jgi:hypothetical protein
MTSKRNYSVMYFQIFDKAVFSWTVTIYTNTKQEVGLYITECNGWGKMIYLRNHFLFTWVVHHINCYLNYYSLIHFTCMWIVVSHAYRKIMRGMSYYNLKKQCFCSQDCMLSENFHRKYYTIEHFISPLCYLNASAPTLSLFSLRYLTWS